MCWRVDLQDAEVKITHVTGVDFSSDYRRVYYTVPRGRGFAGREESRVENWRVFTRTKDEAVEVATQEHIRRITNAEQKVLLYRDNYQTFKNEYGLEG